MLQQTTEYALRVIVHLARLEGVPATTRQIAAATRIPVGYLSKVLQGLSRARLVSSQRGLHGGSVLLVPPEKLSVFDVIEAVNPIPRILSCPMGIESHGSRLCALHRRLDNAMAMVEKAFRESTIADLLSERGGSRPLCETANPANGTSQSVPFTISRAK